jgi:hypothetical protein
MATLQLDYDSESGDSNSGDSNSGDSDSDSDSLPPDSSHVGAPDAVQLAPILAHDDECEENDDVGSEDSEDEEHEPDVAEAAVHADRQVMEKLKPKMNLSVQKHR